MLVSADAFPLNGIGVVPLVFGVESLLFGVPDPRLSPLSPSAESLEAGTGVPTLEDDRTREGKREEPTGLS